VIKSINVGWKMEAALPYMPKNLEVQLFKLEGILTKFEDTLKPLIVKIGDVLAWRKGFAALVLTVFSGMFSATLFLLHEWYRLCDKDVLKTSTVHAFLHDKFEAMHLLACAAHGKTAKEAFHNSFSDLFYWLLGQILDKGWHITFMIIGSVIMVHRAWFLQHLGSSLRVLVRLIKSVVARRKAPAHWLFFRPPNSEVTRLDAKPSPGPASSTVPPAYYPASATQPK
jgi:hypothetical protein